MDGGWVATYPHGMDHTEAVRSDLSADETRELARLVTALAAVMLVFAITGVVIVLGTGDLASVVGTGADLGGAILLLHGRRELLKGNGRRASTLLVVVVLVGVLVLAPIPPPVPALAAAPIMAVAFALSFLNGRRLVAAIVAAVVVSIAAAVIIELTPASPDLPPEFAAVLRVGSMAAVTGLVGLVLYRHRRRLELAVTRAQAAGEALRDSEARYRTVVEDVREVIFRIDGRARWSLLNRAWEELTGHPVASSLGRPSWTSSMPTTGRTTPISSAGCDGGHHEYRHELRLAGADGRTIWVEVSRARCTTPQPSSSVCRAR